MNGQPYLNSGTPQPNWGQSNGPQGTIYIGFDQPVQMAAHPQAPYGPQMSNAQHTGYHTAQNGWSWCCKKSTEGKSKKSPNTLGLIGFVVSLCGLATAALPVAIAGGALSSLALFRRGRFLALTGLVMALANPAVVKQMSFEPNYARLDRRAERLARVELEKQLNQVNAVMAQAEGQIMGHYDSHNKSWPDGIEGNMLVANFKDPWGNSLRFDEMGDRLVLRSFGPDRKAETGDDIVLPIQHFRNATDSQIGQSSSNP